MNDATKPLTQLTNPTPEHRDHTPQDKRDPLLSLLYLLVAALCLAMLFWILVAPATCLIQRSTFHREVLIPFYENIGMFRVLPEHLITKYQGQTIVQLMHIIPSALWSSIIPFQLHPSWRTLHRKLHRRMGYLFTLASISMSLGVPTIIHRHLSFDHYFPSVPVSQQSLSVRISSTPAFFLLLTLWFLVTLLQSVRSARNRDIHRHQEWMVRHVAAGLWVIVQRFMVAPAYMIVYGEWMYPRPHKVPPEVQMKAFAESGLIAVILVLAVGECAVWRIQGERGKCGQSQREISLKGSCIDWRSCDPGARKMLRVISRTGERARSNINIVE